MRKLLRQSIHSINTRLVLHFPLLSILKIHWIMAFAVLLFMVCLLIGCYLPVWINPVYITIIGIIVCVWFGFFWNKRVESYFPALSTSKSKKIIYFSKIFLLTGIFCIPFIIPQLVYNRAKQLFTSSRLFEDAVPYVVNQEFALKHFDELQDMLRVNDSMEQTERRNLNSVFAYNFRDTVPKKQIELDNIVFRRMLHEFYRDYMRDSVATNASVRYMQSIPIIRDSTSAYRLRYHAITAIHDKKQYKWITRTYPWKLSMEMLNNTEHFKKLQILDSLQNESNISIYGSYTGAVGEMAYENYPLFLEFKDKDEFRDYHNKICTHLIGSDKIDLVPFAKRKRHTSANIEGNVFFLGVFSVLFLIMIFFANLMIVKQIKGANFVFYITASFIVLPLIILACELADLPSVVISMIILVFLAAVLLFFLLFSVMGNSRLIKLQNSMLPYLFNLMLLVPVLPFIIDEVLELHAETMPLCIQFCALLIFTTVFSVWKLLSFYSYPQPK